MKKTFSFSKQIMLILISLSVICTCLTGLIGYTVAKKINKKLVLDKLQGVTTLTYNLIDSAVDASIKNYLRAISEKNKNIVEMYYERYKKGELTESEAKKEVEKIISSQTVGNSGYIYVINSKGILKIHPELKNTDISTYDFIKKQISMKYNYIEYLWKNPGEKTPRPKVLYMTYFKPWDYIISVTSYKSEFIKLVNVSDFKKNILSITLGKTGYESVINSQGVLVIHPKMEGVNIYNSKDAFGNYFIREIIRNKNGQITYKWKNPDEASPRDKIVIYKYYAPMDWYLCSGVYIDELYAPIIVLRNTLLFSFAFILLLSIIISSIYGRIIINPILTLTKATSKIMDGNFDVKINNTRNDEIGKLTDIFNNMVIKLKGSMENLKITNHKLEEMNINLENKVSERTLELNKNNEILEKEILERKKTEQLLEYKYNELEETKEKLEEVNKKLEKLSYLDSLTGIPNRRSLDEFLKHEWSRAIREKMPLSIIMIDIDFFKNFNDTYGHQGGDQCLKKIASELSVSINRATDFSARYGGEEFLVILPNTDEESANYVAERIRKNIETLDIPHVSSSISSHVTVSLGISTIINCAGDLLEEFIKCADDALYKSKQTGRNRSTSVKFPE